ncbi:polyprenyl synthetase family protein, partial [bacterium]
MSFDLNGYLAKTSKLAEDYARTLIPPPSGMAATLFEAVSYSFFAGGKRFRPALAYAASEAVCGEGERSIPFGVAIEMIHTYSLIHEDLPSMDDDDLRRGKPTCHIKFGEAMAILAGDALLTDSFTHLSTPQMSKKYGAEALLRCIHEISRSAGGYGMVAGQAIDVMSEGLTLSLPALEYLHIHKTGALIRASVITGAIAAGASPEEEKKLALYADRVGLAFQISDDILDV